MTLHRGVLFTIALLASAACYGGVLGDFNGDDKVTVADLAHFNDAWRQAHAGGGYDAACDLNGDAALDHLDADIMTQEFLWWGEQGIVVMVEVNGAVSVRNLPDRLDPEGSAIRFRVTGTFKSGEITHHSPIGCTVNAIPLELYAGSAQADPKTWTAQVEIPPNVRTDGAPQIHLLTLELEQEIGGTLTPFEEHPVRVLAAGNDAFEAETQEALDFWNAIRAGVGVQPLTIDPNCHNGHQWHAHYLIVNGYPSGHTPHDEEPGKPCFSYMGQNYATKSNLSASTDRRSQKTYTASLIDAPLHRVRMLEPGLFATGMGWELRSGAGSTGVSAAATYWECMLSQDVFSFKDGTPYTGPIEFPCDGQTGVPPSWKFTESFLDQLFPGIAWGSTVGYPISIQWAFWSEDISDVSGELVRKGAGGDTPVTVRVGNTQDIMGSDRNIIVLPTSSLVAGAQHEVTVRCRRGGGALETHTWSFTTGSGPWSAQAPDYEPMFLPPPPQAPRPQ